MKIAFVGKGGSGKTTLAALFALHLEEQGKTILAVDADLNMHLPELLGFAPLPMEKHISYPASMDRIKTYLKGKNERIQTLAHFRKTTPPSRDSAFIRINKSNSVMQDFASSRDNTHLMVVGTYSEDGIGTSCYHNNLAILENVLSHTLEGDSVIVADMVAGIDAFASTLHAQFDLLCLVVEPTRRSVEVFKQYQVLMQEAGLEDSLVVVGNKIANEGDIQFIAENIPQKFLIGCLSDSPYLRVHDRVGGALKVSELEKDNQELLSMIWEKLQVSHVDPDIRLRHLWDLHVRYVAQPSITERLGDLRSQIDPDFSYHRLMT